MQLKKLFTFLAFGLVIVTVIVLVGSFSKAAISAKAPDPTVGYVDMDRIQKEHPDFISLASMMKDKEAELNFFKSYLNKQLEGINRDLKKQMDAEKAGKSTDEQAKIEQKYQEQFQAKGSELSNQLTQKTNEITGYVNQQKTALMDKLKATIEGIAVEMKLTLVLDKSARLYGGVDITQTVLDKVKGSTKNDTKDSKTGK